MVARCQRQIPVRGRRRIGPSSCRYRWQYSASGGSSIGISAQSLIGSWQYGASGGSSIGLLAQSLIGRVVFHRNIGAESYWFIGQYSTSVGSISQAY